MVFHSFSFLLLLIPIFLVYWSLLQKRPSLQKYFLLLVSCIFYILWNPWFLLILLAVTLITYWGAILIHQAGSRHHRTVLIVCFTLLGLLPLLFFKYYGFLSDTLTDLLGLCGISLSFPKMNLAVPVGISFFTFQAVGYLLDVAADKCSCESNFFDYTLFVSFFPQVTSGPISTANELLPQIKKPKVFDYSQAVWGLRYLLAGMFFKVVVADRAGIFVDTVYANLSKYDAIHCILAALIYSVQIYSDFAGYSMMAVGIAKLFGFDLVQNFKRPYFAVSVTDFWRRWHISLSRWLKEHIYIPLGGNRCGKLKNALHILITFLVSGIWHGADWTFLIWGGLHGLFQIIEKICGFSKKAYHGIGKACRILLTFLIVTFAWIFFRAPDVSTAFSFLKQTVNFSGGFFVHSETLETLGYFLLGSVPLFLVEFLREFFPCVFRRLFGKKILRWCGYVAAFVAIMLIGVLDGGSFIYVSF